MKVNDTEEGEAVFEEETYTQSSQTPIDFAEEERGLNEMIANGDVEGVMASPALIRKPERARVDLILEAIDKSIELTTKDMWELYKGGQRYVEAANRANKKTTHLENIKKEVLRMRYESQKQDIKA